MPSCVLLLSYFFITFAVEIKLNERMKKGYFRYKQFTICQVHAAMKVGTDADLLGALAEGGAEVLDIGTGTGVLALMLAQRCPLASVTALEIDDNAIIDATENFAASPFADRITLRQQSFQDYLAADSSPRFDSIVCNPPYFDKSLECPDLGRTRARHSSSLPFDVLVNGSYALLREGGCFTVCIPPEVYADFTSLAAYAGFRTKVTYQIKSVPEKGTKRYIIVFAKDCHVEPRTETYCMRNADRTVSEWYKTLMEDFLL